MGIRYSDLSNNIVQETNFDSLPDRDQIRVLFRLLSRFDPGTKGDPAAYEEYQRACGVILKEANKLWGGREP